MRLSRLVRYCYCLLAGICVFTQAGQTQSQKKTGVVRVVMTDTLGAVVPDVDLIVSDSANSTVLRTLRVPASGKLIVSDLPADARYVFQSRKMGFRRAMSPPVLVTTKDTVELAFELERMQELAAVEVKESQTDPAYVINDKELGRHPIENLRLGKVLERYRKRMLGDPYRCAGQPIENYYVNGIRWSAPQPGMEDKVAYPPLLEIFASDIQEVRYINCWERDSPKLRNSLIIVLKPGVKFPAKHWGEPQRKPTRPPKDPKSKG